MGKRRLIITADDLGMSRAINDAIHECARVGVVTAAGILANGAALDSVREGDLNRVALGVHLNLTEGRPLTTDRHVHTLIRNEGHFYSLVGLLFRASLGLVRPDQVERECAAQINRARDLGFRVSYADSHQHIHAHPRLAIPFARATRAAGLTRVRRAADWSGGPDYLKAWALAVATRLSAAHYADFTRVAAARGIARRPTSLDRLERILAGLPPGLTELVVHLRRPGPIQSGEEKLGDREARQAEWRTLMDPRVGDMLARHGVELVRPAIDWNARAAADNRGIERP